MKKLSFFSILILFIFPVSAQQVHLSDCAATVNYFDETEHFTLWGNVYAAKKGEFAQLCVKVVSRPSEANMLVFRTSSRPNDCGQWRFVSKPEKASFSVRFVKEYEDLRIYYVTSPQEAGCRF